MRSKRRRESSKIKVTSNKNLSPTRLRREPPRQMGPSIFLLLIIHLISFLCSSAEPASNHATIAWFSFNKKKTDELTRPFLILSYHLSINSKFSNLSPLPCSELDKKHSVVRLNTCLVC